MASRDHAARARPRPLGPLEWSVLDAVWARGEPVTVHDIEAQFPRLAYTTLMTTLDRLYMKRILGRERRGRAFAYRAIVGRDALTTQLAGAAFGELVERNPNALRPLLSFVVDMAEKHDPAVLNELAALVRRRMVRGSE